ncbi:hypothetical protein HK100_006242 [Physocladia obscura]|uniref:Uncharacterized protein n=1 Tax=Physocladia obscura TaxID=109957 RepID=A0AAD5T624_9FUNG|nr:hypothetical protein HK100_006242 [Physocladia obscura]
MAVQEIVMVSAPTRDLLTAETERRGTSFPVLACQDNNGRGGKCFMAFPDHDTCLQYIESKPPSERNQYEIIRGDQSSCLYLDIDPNHTTNPEGLADSLKGHLKQFLTGLGLDQCEILVLSASNDTKTSFHFVVRGEWVTENCEVRVRLVRLFISWIKNKDPAFDTSVIDSRVYSSWQCFRTIFSTKVNQDRWFVPIHPKVNFEAKEYFVTYIPDLDNTRVIKLTDLPQ